MLTGARARDPAAARRRDVERRRRRAALHQPGDGEEPRPPHPRQARGRHAHARGRDRAARGDHRLSPAGIVACSRSWPRAPERSGCSSASAAHRREAERARLSERIITAEQDERRRLALFLHDGPVQSLSGIALMLDAAAHAIEDGRGEDARGDPRLARSTATATRSARCATSPSTSSRSCCATRGSARPSRRSRTSSGWSTGCRSTSTSTPASALGEGAQVGLYQIIREALSQAVRRGPPSRISVVVARGRRGRDRDDRHRRRRARAPQGRARGARGARGDPQRPLLRRAGRGERHVCPRGTAAVRSRWIASRP